MSFISGSGRSPGGGNGNPLQHSCLENPHGPRSPAGYSPWGHKELDTTATKHTYTPSSNFISQESPPSNTSLTLPGWCMEWLSCFLPMFYTGM